MYQVQFGTRRFQAKKAGNMGCNSSGLRIHEASQQNHETTHLQKNPLAQLKKISSLVASGKEPFEDLSEQIEDLAYTICESGDSVAAVEQLQLIACFFENLENKNEENNRDLADTYLLIGQLFQFTEKYEESINWFKKAAIVDDQYTVSYHNIALSYIKIGEIEGAIRSLVQEVLFSPGNYYSYLILTDLYESRKQYNEAEHCLKQLLERDPLNIQGIHRLIRYYTTMDMGIDVQLLIRRLLSVKKQYTIAESIIRTFYLCLNHNYKGAFDFIHTWLLTSPEEPAVYLAHALVFEQKKNSERMILELETFKKFYAKRGAEVMRSKVNEFCCVVGDEYSRNIRKILLEN